MAKLRTPSDVFWMDLNLQGKGMWRETVVVGLQWLSKSENQLIIIGSRLYSTNTYNISLFTKGKNIYLPSKKSIGAACTTPWP